jgi:excisionase family DNA binding protein
MTILQVADSGKDSKHFNTDEITRSMQIIVILNRIIGRDETAREASSFQKGMTLAQNVIGRLALRGRTSLVNKRTRIRLQRGVTMFDEKKPPASAGTPDGRPRIDREPLLDSHQAAAILKVHPRTLQRLVHRGEIAAVHVGKLWRFRASALTAWIDRDIAS